MITDFDLKQSHHLALVVEDLESAMVRFSGHFELSWADPWTGTIPVVVADDELAPAVSFTLSVEGPPHFELIQSTDQRVWRPTSGWHHVGFWVADFEDAVANAERDGLSIEAISPTSDFAYLRSPDGARIEFVNERARSDFDRWLGGGRL
jgi:catechol 2,3-dioxygenase-like lactoylglutathione lyase family enzyme